MSHDSPTGRAESTLPRIPTTRVPVPRLTLCVESGGETSPDVERTFDGDLVRIGSHPSNELVVADRQVSRFHCSLQKTSHGWRLTDTGSLNGTYLDGVLVRDADLRMPESELRVGDTTIRVVARDSVRDSVYPLARSFGAIVGRSAPMQRLFELLRRISPSSTDVLVEGESGTGKELVASEIVAHSERADGPLVVVDCGAISPTLIESELFGHAKGAFTGATRDRPGAFELAHGGTLFLDEIGELPLSLQPKLLRALAQREVRRLGDDKVRSLDVRVIAATNRTLEREVNTGAFREDLYYRLSVLTVRVPPLRERIDDLEDLVDLFLSQLGRPEERASFDPLLPEMRRHTWPGNVRELRNYVERTTVLGPEASPLSRRSDPGIDEPAPREIDLSLSFGEAKDRMIEDFERRYLAALLHETEGNVSLASRRARLDRMHLHRLLQKHRIHPRSSGPKSG